MKLATWGQVCNVQEQLIETRNQVKQQLVAKGNKKQSLKTKKPSKGESGSELEGKEQKMNEGGGKSNFLFLVRRHRERKRPCKGGEIITYSPRV